MPKTETETAEPRRAGRPRVMDKPARLWLRVDEDAKRKATEQAEQDGHPDLTSALRELVAAYGEGRVVIRKRATR